MKYFVLYFTLLTLLPLSVHADYIFEQAYEYEVHDEPWDVICLDGGDFNDDGLPDFVASYYDTSSEDTYLYTFLGNGDCSFDVLMTDIFTYPLGSITVSDFNNNGYDDLLIGEGYGTYAGMASTERDTIHLFEGNGDGTFTELGILNVKNVWITSGDLNDDGNTDLVTSGSESGDGAVLVKLGNGNFTFQGTASYASPYILHTVQILDDMDLDGYVDIGVHNSGEISFFYGNGDGTFQPAVVVAEHGAEFCFGFIGVGDFNEDSMPDMAATGSPDYSEVLVWDGSGAFPYDSINCIGNGCTWIEIEDFDLDSHLDVAISKTCWHGYVLPGYGDGHFPSWWQPDSLLMETVFDETYSVLSADFDLDGDYDLVFCEDAYNQPECIRCYRNTTITQGCEGESAGSGMDPALDVSPNPFSSFVSIKVSGYPDGSGNLQIFDLSGRLVVELKPVIGDGEVFFIWDGISSGGSDLPSGIYTARLDSEINTTSVTLLKLE